MRNINDRIRSRSSGLLAVCATLLASSATSATVLDDTTTDTAPERTRAANERSSGAGGNTPPTVEPPYGAAGSSVGWASDDRGNAAPTRLDVGVPVTVLDAYQHAFGRTNLVQPTCRIPLALLAAIGKVESGHARGGRVDGAGTTLRPILGPVLSGGAFAAIHDTDGGALDGDPTWDRAVGPMQFIPSTWAGWAVDGNNDGHADPHNVYDASLASARYLCAANRDLGTPDGLDAAILSYNHSTSYLNLVRSWMVAYGHGSIAIPDGTGTVPVEDAPNPVKPAAATVPQPNQPPPSPAPPSSGNPTQPPVPAPNPVDPEPNPVPGQEPPCDGPGLVDTAVGLVGALLGNEQDQQENCVPPPE